MEWKLLDVSSFDDIFVTIDNESKKKRQIAKDVKYLETIQSHWKFQKEEAEAANDVQGNIRHLVETTSVTYNDSTDSSSLYGHLFRRHRRGVGVYGNDDRSTIPAILLFHTAAGPQDIFLFQKAYQLVQTFDCIVMICDIFSDELGWGWDSDKTKYKHVRKELSLNNHQLLHSRTMAAITTLTTTISDNIGIDVHRIGILGWCLGGQPILELGITTRSTNKENDSFSIKAMISYHGVFRREEQQQPEQEQQKDGEEEEKSRAVQKQEPLEMLICNGALDPFISLDDVTLVKENFIQRGHVVSVLQLENAKHGFSNPAQKYNENPSFDYNEIAANKAWKETEDLLRRKLFS